MAARLHAVSAWLVTSLALLIAPTAPLAAQDRAEARSVAATGSAAAPLTSAEFTREHARHLLLRAGFGGTPEQIDALHARGLEGAVRHLVDYELVHDPLPSHGVLPVPRPAREEIQKMSREERQQAQQMVRREDQQRFQQLRGWWMERMLTTPRPLEEKLTLFWHGHFTSGYRDVRNAFHMALQNDLLREHASGNFRLLLQAISRDPAMLEYLDNNRNNRRAPNENYARELLELFTLGVGNYTEQDIKEAARAFTGWTFRNSEFTFQRNNHDAGVKTFLGSKGTFDGDDVIRIVLEQEAAPRFLARKLLTFFAVEPTDAEVEPYAQLLRQFDWELKPLLRRLFSSRWFYSDRVMGKQIKSPVVLVVSTMRAMSLERGPGLPMARACDGIGQSLMEPPNVKGWDGGAAWISSSNLLARYNLARTLIAGGEAARGRQPRRPAAGEGRATRREQDDRRPEAKDEAMAGAMQEQPMQEQPMQEQPMQEQPMQEESMQPSMRPDPASPPPATGNTARRQRRVDVPPRPAVQSRIAPRFSTLALVLAAKATDPDSILELLEERFLVVPLAAERRQALLDFLRGADGSPALDLGQRRQAAVKLDECLHLLMSTPEFQIC